jgi:hypothetical protein
MVFVTSLKSCMDVTCFFWINTNQNILVFFHYVFLFILQKIIVPNSKYLLFLDLQVVG